jgi:hypothetical protein
LKIIIGLLIFERRPAALKYQTICEMKYQNDLLKQKFVLPAFYYHSVTAARTLIIDPAYPA